MKKNGLCKKCGSQMNDTTKDKMGARVYKKCTNCNWKTCEMRYE
jgi:hypothetical protein